MRRAKIFTQSIEKSPIQMTNSAVNFKYLYHLAFKYFSYYSFCLYLFSWNSVPLCWFNSESYNKDFFVFNIIAHHMGVGINAYCKYIAHIYGARSNFCIKVFSRSSKMNFSPKTRILYNFALVLFHLKRWLFLNNVKIVREQRTSAMCICVAVKFHLLCNYGENLFGHN